MTLSATLRASLIVAAESVERPNSEQRPANLCCELFETAEGALRTLTDNDIIFGAGWQGSLVQEQGWSVDECIRVQLAITEGLTAITLVHDGVIGPQHAAPIVSKALRTIAWLIDPGVAG